MKTRKQRKHRFVVGYCREGNCIYGKERGRSIRNDWTIARPMTLWQAKSMLNDLHGAPKAIYELVPVREEPK